MAKGKRKRSRPESGDVVGAHKQGSRIVKRGDPSDPDLEYRDGVLVYTGELAPEDLDVLKAIADSRDERARRNIGSKCPSKE